MHSGRAGMTTLLAAAGFDAAYIIEYGFWSSQAYEDYIRGTLFTRHHPQPHYVPDRNAPVAEVRRLRGIVIEREWAKHHRGRAGVPTRALGSRVPHWPPRPAAPAGPRMANILNVLPFSPWHKPVLMSAGQRSGAKRSAAEARSWARRPARSAVE
jgi:hypothetical protein